MAAHHQRPGTSGSVLKATAVCATRWEGSSYGDSCEGVWFANRRPLDYDSVGFIIVESDRPGPLASLQIGDQWYTAGDLGPMAVGDRRLVPYRRSEDRHAASILRLRITCLKGTEVWQVPTEVEITSNPFIG